VHAAALAMTAKATPHRNKFRTIQIKRGAGFLATPGISVGCCIHFKDFDISLMIPRLRENTNLLAKCVKSFTNAG
jgi:hypothetical protein